MNVKRFLVILSGVALISLLVVYQQFLQANQVNQADTEEEDAIHVLAPYETRLHQQILEEIGSEYSRGENRSEVIFEFVPKESLKKELSARSLMGKDKVDVVICENTLMPELIKLGMLREIPVTSDLYERIMSRKMWSCCRDDGKYYGIPFTCDPYVLFYREDRLAQNNQDIPQTWEDLISCGLAIQSTGTKSIGVAIKRPEEAANLYRLMLYSMGGNFHSIEKQPGVQSFDMIRKLFRYGLSTKEMLTYTQEDLAREFAQGKVSIMVNQLSAATILRTSQISFSIGVAPIPEDQAGGNFLNGHNIGLSMEAGKDAMDFLFYLTQKDVSERISGSMDTLPVFSDVSYQGKSKVFLENHEKFIEESRLVEPYNSWTKMSEDIAQGVYEMLESSQMDAQSIAERVYDQVRVAIMSG